MTAPPAGRGGGRCLRQWRADGRARRSEEPRTGTQHWVLVFSCAALVAAGAAVLGWQRRDRTPAATSLAALMAGVAAWSAADAVFFSPVSAAVRLVCAPALYAASGLVVIAAFALARTVADPSWRLSRRAALLLAVEPALLIVAFAVPATRDLVLPGAHLDGPASDLRIAVGPLLTARTAGAHVLVAVAHTQLLRRWSGAAGVFRRQIGVLPATGALSTVGDVVAVLAIHNGSGVEITPLFTLVSGVVDSWALFRLGLLRLVPVAREQVVDTVPDGVLVVDPGGVLIDVNPAAVRMLQRLRPEVRGELVGRLLADVAGPRAVAALAATAGHGGHQVAEVRPGLWLDVRSSAVSDPRGRPLGRIPVVRDVSEQQERQAAVERLNEQLAEQVEVIERLRAELAEEAVRDPLTGLHNRRHLDRALAADLVRRPRAGELAVLVVDVDHVTTVNDRFGHAAGDRVLTAVAAVLDAAVREGDTAARLGGEEFVLVLPGAGRQQALERAERVRREIAAARHRLGGEDHAVTVSVGVAVCPSEAAGAAALLEAADRAL
ncbi:histidine kinase N-terminal 7TM domain-containing diguanylate cyclase [Geodermatophilus maliterrae]|uniref:Diguanylate cyclase n=1 Tax=Geodermatophilus maliterrae TaxID=3162531 RepID=A0ABV3XC03_9ACTN